MMAEVSMPTETTLAWYFRQMPLIEVNDSIYPAPKPRTFQKFPGGSKLVKEFKSNRCQLLNVRTDPCYIETIEPILQNSPEWGRIYPNKTTGAEYDFSAQLMQVMKSYVNRIFEMDVNPILHEFLDRDIAIRYLDDRHGCTIAHLHTYRECPEDEFVSPDSDLSSGYLRISVQMPESVWARLDADNKVDIYILEVPKVEIALADTYTVHLHCVDPDMPGPWYNLYSKRPERGLLFQFDETTWEFTGFRLTVQSLIGTLERVGEWAMFSPPELMETIHSETDADSLCMSYW